MKTALLGLIVLVAGAWFFAPWFAFQDMRSAAAVGDAAGVEAVVDFPALRASLRPQVEALVAAPGAAPAHPAARPWWLPSFIPLPDRNPVSEVIGGFDREARVVRRVNVLASPAGLAGLARGRAWVRDWGMSRFRIDVRPPGAAKAAAPTTFTFSRHGLYDWKLVHVRLGAGVG
ncbi:MAG: DUF2939 domain-containing protein [Caulobacteraceae bacterium]